MTFDIEYMPEINYPDTNPEGHHWWAATAIDSQGNIAVGSGHTVWEAIGNCLADIEPSRENLAFVQAVVRQALDDGSNPKA